MDTTSILEIIGALAEAIIMVGLAFGYKAHSNQKKQLKEQTIIDFSKLEKLLEQNLKKGDKK